MLVCIMYRGLIRTAWGLIFFSNLLELDSVSAEFAWLGTESSSIEKAQ
jgi:hypothetical protein